MTASRRLAVVALAAGLGVAGCGGGGSGTTKGGYATGAPVAGKRGGTLTVLSRGDVDSLDPGAAYYQLSYLVAYATQRPLFSYRPEYTQAVPDLAVQTPQVTDAGHTVTVRLRDGVRFSPPVRRTVTSRDVKHAIERGFDPRVGNPYAAAYFGSIVGADRAHGGPIAGIQTPDPLTIVFRLARPRSTALIGALSLPLTAPIPAGRAGPGRVATGPYMVERYVPGREIELVRNPSWDRGTDFRPAYLDRIVVDEGNADAVAASRRILRGRGMVNAQGDLDVPPSIVEQVVLGSAAQRRQFVAGTFTGGLRYLALDTRTAPLRDVDVRRAIAAALDRRALLRQRLGGPRLGDVPTHLLPPGIPGFDVAAPTATPDFLAHPGGDPVLAAQYLVKAGYPSGRYDGAQPLTVVSADTRPGREVAALVRDQLQPLGFRVALRLVADDSRLCGASVPPASICAGTRWQPDFPDPQLLLSRWQPGPELLDPVARARFWGYADGKVTSDVPAVPWLWDKATGIESRDVAGVIDRFGGGWDLSFTSLR